MRVGGHEINLDVLKATPCGWHKYKLFEAWLIIPGSSWRHWNGSDSDCNLDAIYVSISASQTCLLTRIAWGSTKSPGHTRPQLSLHLWLWDTCILHFLKLSTRFQCAGKFGDHSCTLTPWYIFALSCGQGSIHCQRTEKNTRVPMGGTCLQGSSWRWSWNQKLLSPIPVRDLEP